MAKYKKGKFKRGTWIEQDMAMSRAYLSLGGFAPQLLILFLMKRDIDKKHNCLNANSITMTYAELENIHNRGKRPKKDQAKDGITKTWILRAIEELMAKGFIKIVHRGGTYKQDKSIYALTDNWKYWQKGMVIFKREIDIRHRGYRKAKLPESVREENSNLTHEKVTQTHVRKRDPKQDYSRRFGL